MPPMLSSELYLARMLIYIPISTLVHGAFAGYSGITVGICNSHYVYLPIPEVISSTRRVDPDSRMWHRCLTSTGQPDFL
ncbi:hypothetical protein C5167_042401 [Papaver somniferum]|uniref:Uncharacterized protein n=1 Tax=Papaver somniferum TaxID=3469 RepID=A0A4Y7L2P2_PAPSO|nr:hypothetical protein C5167_042401 [Papaver somniferum]